MILPILLTVAASQITVVDGDTLKIDHQRYRLLGIDAPELHGCPRQRKCAPGDGHASKRNLKAMLTGSIRIAPVTRDRYGRFVAQVYSGGSNLACAQIEAGQAVYKPAWDNGKRLARECVAAR